MRKEQEIRKKIEEMKAELEAVTKLELVFSVCSLKQEINILEWALDGY